MTVYDGRLAPVTPVLRTGGRTDERAECRLRGAPGERGSSHRTGHVRGGRWLPYPPANGLPPEELGRTIDVVDDTPVARAGLADPWRVVIGHSRLYDDTVEFLILPPASEGPSSGTARGTPVPYSPTDSKAGSELPVAP